MLQCVVMCCSVLQRVALGSRVGQGLGHTKPVDH